MFKFLEFSLLFRGTFGMVVLAVGVGWWIGGTDGVVAVRGVSVTGVMR